MWHLWEAVNFADLAITTCQEVHVQKILLHVWCGRVSPYLAVKRVEGDIAIMMAEHGVCADVYEKSILFFFTCRYLHVS